MTSEVVTEIAGVGNGVLLLVPYFESVSRDDVQIVSRCNLGSFDRKRFRCFQQTNLSTTSCLRPRVEIVSTTHLLRFELLRTDNRLAMCSSDIAQRLVRILIPKRDIRIAPIFR